LQYSLETIMPRLQHIYDSLLSRTQ
jgi:hypothetical protein